MIRLSSVFENFLLPTAGIWRLDIIVSLSRKDRANTFGKMPRAVSEHRPYGDKVTLDIIPFPTELRLLCTENCIDEPVLHIKN